MSFEPAAAVVSGGVCLVGSAPIPAAAGLGVTTLAIEVELEGPGGDVVDVRVSLPSQHLEGTLRRILVGRPLEGHGDACSSLLRSYRGPASSAVVIALARVQALAGLSAASAIRGSRRVMRGAA